jgi:hypothetical protein
MVDDGDGILQEAAHRGRIQAQGGGTEKSEAWSRDEPPTESGMNALCDSLEKQLTPRERQDRERPLASLRRFIHLAASAGGVIAPVSKSFMKPGSKDIRIDLEVIKGQACVPD